MISNAKIRINLKEAKKNAEKTLTKPRKDWEIRIFKGFSINTAHGQSQLSQEKVTLPKINQNEFDNFDKLVSYHGMMIYLPEIFVAKRLIFIEKNVKNAIKTMTFDRYLGILTKFSKLLLFLHT